jgi:hypothetical protein
MRTIIIVLFVLLLACSPTQPTQGWTYGGNHNSGGSSVRQTTDGGFIIAGNITASAPDSSDVYLIRTNASGETLWTRSYGGPGNNAGNSVEQTSDGGYVIAGYTTSFGAGGYDVYLLKTNSSGDTLWTRTYGGTGDDLGTSVEPTSDGGYVVAGYTTSFGAGGYDVYLIKTNSSGETLWTRTYGGTGNDAGYSVEQTSDGGYIVTGYTAPPSAATKDVYLIKTNASGDARWTNSYGGAGLSEGHSVRQTSDGGYIIAGYHLPSDSKYTSVYVIKTDAGGIADKE